LRAPALPEHFVQRQRLHALLDDLARAPLTMVVAPAGAGKTMLLAGWMAETDARGAWLSLDDIDRDPAQLWLGVMSALDTFVPGRCATSIDMLRRPYTLDQVVGQLLNDLEEADAPDPSVLIIDDVHLIDDERELMHSLGLFLLHLPAWLHVVLLARRDVDLPVDRLRARGQLGVVRFAELRFSRTEGSEMLSRLAPTLSPDEIDDTVGDVAGWAAGLQMAALAARSNLAQGLVGSRPIESEPLVDDFVWHEVLAAESDDLIDIMLDISVVDRVNSSLAEALTDRSDASAMLHRAEARGLFVARLGAAGWYEVHSLVRSSLYAELARRSPARLADRHRRAAAWFDQHDEVPIALDHWILSGEHREALRLLAARHADLYDAGREAVIVRAIAAISPSLRDADLETMIELAWCQLLVNRRAFTEAVEQALWWFDHTPADEATRNRLTMLRSFVVMVHGDWAAAGAMSRQALAAVGQAWWRDPLTRFGWNIVARQVAYGEDWHEDSGDVRDATLALSRDPERRAALEGTRAVGHAFAGHPVEALQVVAGVRRVTEVTNMTILRVESALAEALAHRELGDWSRALGELRALAEMPAETMLFVSVLARLELVDAHLDTGDVEAATSDFEAAESLITHEGLVGLRDRLARTGSLLALSVGDHDVAGAWAESVADPFWGPIALARVALATGDRGTAMTLLEGAPSRCVRHEVVLGLLRARAMDDAEESMKLAAAAIEVAAAHELLQSVASEGPDAFDLAERVGWRAPAAWMDRLRRLVAAGAGRPPAGSRQLVEQLTERERDVLRYLPSRLTVREIASELYVSVNTLKFHLKVIYRKLGVSSRAEAAAKARQLMSK
jgi:LuxR family maltose regulon positive regulatory protein